MALRRKQSAFSITGSWFFQSKAFQGHSAVVVCDIDLSSSGACDIFPFLVGFWWSSKIMFQNSNCSWFYFPLLAATYFLVSYLWSRFLTLGGGVFFLHAMYKKIPLLSAILMSLFWRMIYWWLWKMVWYADRSIFRQPHCKKLILETMDWGKSLLPEI